LVNNILISLTHLGFPELVAGRWSLMKVAGNVLFSVYSYVTEISMQHRSRAIILRRTAYGDADWIVHLFCRERGRLSGMAKSARSSRKRFAGALEPGSVVDVRFSERRGSQLVRLEEAQVVFPINGFLRNLERIEEVSNTLRIAAAFLQEREANPAKFDLLVERIMRLGESDPDPFEVAAFRLKWLALSGYAPSLSACAVCGRATSRDRAMWRFDFDRGGFVCTGCGLGASAAMRLSDAAISGLVSLAKERVPEDASHSAAAGAVLNGYIDHVLGRPLSKTAF
jgi:DNA repair protein RecO (recombination protein O)